MSRDRPHARTLTGGNMPIVPPLAERQQPGLSATLTGPIAPDRCRCCGAPHVSAVPLARWSECDAWDRPQTPPVVVVLCRRCSDRLIEPHARLYVQFEQLAPVAGCMSICMHCVQRVGTSCRSPVLTFNGGPGLVYGWKDGAQPTSAYVCGSRGRGRHGGGCRVLVLWPGRVETCSGREVVQLVRADPHPGDEPTTPLDEAEQHAARR